MPLPEELDRLSRWNIWANRQVGDTLRASGGRPESAMAAYQHIFETEVVWLRRIAGAQDDVPLWGGAPFEEVDAWEKESAARLAAVREKLSEEWLATPFTYHNFAGKEFSNPITPSLLQTLLHSMQYRGEAAGFLNAAGHKVPDFDLIFWMRLGEPE